MSNIWISSDWHLGHKNIVKGVSTWESKDACRDFATLEEHDKTLIENINNNVKREDVIYFLGDFSFGGKDNIFKYRGAIKCKNIHFIYGNHDHFVKKDYNNCQGLFKTCNEVLYKTIAGENYVFCHYSMRTWDRAHHGSIMLYGHSHGTLEDYGTMINVGNEKYHVATQVKKYFKTMDVGVDTHKEFRPYHIDEIREIMKDRISLHVDHHNTNTN